MAISSVLSLTVSPSQKDGGWWDDHILFIDETWLINLGHAWRRVSWCNISFYSSVLWSMISFQSEGLQCPFNLTAFLQAFKCATYLESCGKNLLFSDCFHSNMPFAIYLSVSLSLYLCIIIISINLIIELFVCLCIIYILYLYLCICMWLTTTFVYLTLTFLGTSTVYLPFPHA